MTIQSGVDFAFAAEAHELLLATAPFDNAPASIAPSRGLHQVASLVTLPKPDPIADAKGEQNQE